MMADRSSDPGLTTDDLAKIGRLVDASNLMVFIDESGDHGLQNLSTQFPLLTIAMVIVRRDEYFDHIVPAFNALKTEFFGHKRVVLHERDIRKRKGQFRTLGSASRHLEFEERLRATLEEAPFLLLSTTIDKRTYAASPRTDPTLSPYTVCFISALAALEGVIPGFSHAWPPPELVVESRGFREDKELAAVLSQLGREPSSGLSFSYALRFAGKQQHTTGLEVADMVANPISRHVLGINQPLVPSELLRLKFFGGTPADAAGSAFPRSHIVIQVE